MNYVNKRRAGLLLWEWGMLVFIAASPLSVRAQYATEDAVISPSLFTVDSQSSGGYDPADILGVEVPGRTWLAASQLGLEGNSIDGLSFNKSPVADRPFALLFSVGREGKGGAQPDLELQSAGVLFNAADQASKNQAAGDEFVSLNLWNRFGNRLGAAINNNALVSNNFDEGGTDFGCMPPGSATQQFPVGTAQDNVTALASMADMLQWMSRGSAVRLYGSVSASKSGSLGPADIFVATLGQTPLVIQLYASADQIGLVPGDDIDALIVFDMDNNGTWNAGDQVLISLSPGSPTLKKNRMSPADVLSILCEKNSTRMTVLATAEELGLTREYNVDALELTVVEKSEAREFAKAVAIGRKLDGLDQIIRARATEPMQADDTPPMLLPADGTIPVK